MLSLLLVVFQHVHMLGNVREPGMRIEVRMDTRKDRLTDHPAVEVSIPPTVPVLGKTGWTGYVVVQ
jgi:hypothetical protein